MPALQRVSPTRMELTRLKRRLKTAERGHKLLKDKRDEMVRRFMLLIRQNRKLRAEVEAELTSALREFSLARAVMVPQVLEEALLIPARSAAVTTSTQNIMSVDVPVLTIDQSSLAETRTPYGYFTTSAELDGAVSTLAAALPRLLQLAEIEATCARLADEIEKTRRRVNALEHVLIPQFRTTIRAITMKLDENERGNLSRLMKVKEMLQAQEG